MTLIVDTYNVLHSGLPEAPDEPGADILHLANRIAGSRFRAENHVLLVCDGVPPPVTNFPVSHRGCRILFAGSGCEADALIEDLIREDSVPSRLLVVSSDRRILKAAKKRRAKTLTSPAFLFQLATPAPRPPDRTASARESGLAPSKGRALKDGEVRHWMQYFGPDTAGADAPSSPDPLASTKPRAGAESQEDSKPAERKPPGAPVTEDPLLKKLLRESGAEISPDDLDMERWLNGPQ